MTANKQIRQEKTERHEAVRLQIQISWYEENVHLPITYRHKRPRPMFPNSRRISFVSRLMHPKFPQYDVPQRVI